jgi:hypothetical protein
MEKMADYVAAEMADYLAAEMADYATLIRPTALMVQRRISG